MRLRLALFFLGCASLAAANAGQIALPIYIEDSHAGSFYWLAQQLQLDEPCTLLHFDAHSDASSIFDSDRIRSRLRRVDSLGQRAELLRQWRSDGVIQCFNWIEPLMPSPIAEVIWIPGEQVAAPEREQKQRAAAEHLDGHAETAPRTAGKFAARYCVLDLEELAATKIGGAVVATIDLDYFAGLEAAERAARFERIWKFVTEQRNLRAITIAISRPYLSNDEEADALLRLALQGALSLPTARIEFEPFQRVGHDRSLRARDYQKEKREVPFYDLEKCSAETRALLLGNRERLSVREDGERWNKTLAGWAAAAPAFHLAIKNHQPSTDEIWRISATEVAELTVIAAPWYAQFGRVQWIVQTPIYPRCNLTSSNNEAGFARDAPPRPRWRETILPTGEKTFSTAELRAFFDSETGCGAVRIKARIASETWVRETPLIEIRRSNGTGFRAALLEQFGLPYLFGSGALRDGSNTGPETGWGADCANFLILALRRQGERIPWSNPKQFRKYLEPIAQDVSLGEASGFNEEEIERGLFLHLGSHVAALIEDRPPLGVLNAEDVFAHQLEGPPELITAGELLRRRGKTRFDLLRLPDRPVTTDLVIGGDVMLGRSVGEKIRDGLDPFAGIRELLQRAGNKVVNLECVVSAEGESASGKKFHFRAPAEAASALARAGVNLVSVANNHAQDFGPDALLDSKHRLRAAGVSAISDYAFEQIVCGDSRVALLAINDSGTKEVDRVLLEQRITQARETSEVVIALLHWGEENTAAVSERQRDLARWLIDHGVDLIAGSHPHCLQSLDYYHGRPIVYSLGNLVFDQGRILPGWNRGALLKVGFTPHSSRMSVRLIPIELDQRGFPRPSRSTTSLPDDARRSRAAPSVSSASAEPSCGRVSWCCMAWCPNGGPRWWRRCDRLARKP